MFLNALTMYEMRNVRLRPKLNVWFIIIWRYKTSFWLLERVSSWRRRLQPWRRASRRPPVFTSRVCNCVYSLFTLLHFRIISTNTRVHYETRFDVITTYKYAIRFRLPILKVIFLNYICIPTTLYRRCIFITVNGQTSSFGIKWSVEIRDVTTWKSNSIWNMTWNQNKRNDRINQRKYTVHPITSLLVMTICLHNTQITPLSILR